MFERASSAHERVQIRYVTFLALRRTALAWQVDHGGRAHALLETALGVPGVRPAPVVDLDEGDQLQEGDRVHAAHDGGVDWKG